MRKRQYERALADYEEAGPALPQRSFVCKNRGDDLRLLGQYARAIADYRKALALKIDEPNKKQIEQAFKELGIGG